MTTLTDDFNRSDAATLGTASGGFSWSYMTAATNLGITSNQAATKANAFIRARADSDLASPAHYAQIVIGGLGVAGFGSGMGPCVQCSPSADTCYMLYITDNGSGSRKFRAYKVIAGTATQLGSTVDAAETFPLTAYISFDGINQLVTKSNGTTRHTITDTSITSNVRTGIVAGQGSGQVAVGDSFECGDLAAATGNPWYYRLQEAAAARIRLPRRIWSLPPFPVAA